MKKYHHYIEISKKGEDDRKLARLQTSDAKATADQARLKLAFPEMDVIYVASSEKEKVFNHIPVTRERAV